MLDSKECGIVRYDSWLSPIILKRRLELRYLDPFFGQYLPALGECEDVSSVPAEAQAEMHSRQLSPVSQRPAS